MIEFRRVSKIYHTGTHALKDVSFKIMDGEFVFVIGRSGAGKSTLIKLLTCEEKPSEGNVLIDDFDIGRIRRSLVPFLRRNIGMVFQDFRLIYTKTVFENVAFAMEIIGASRRSIQRRVPIVLSIVGLREKSKALPGQLSGGEQQRVAIARAMVNNPMLILADEPTGNLDPSNSESVMALLEEINRSGTTVIICTHDHSMVDKMKKRVIEIYDGSLIRDDCEGAYAACNPVCPAFDNEQEDLPIETGKPTKYFYDDQDDAPVDKAYKPGPKTDSDIIQTASEVLTEISFEAAAEDVQENYEDSGLVENKDNQKAGSEANQVLSTDAEQFNDVADKDEPADKLSEAEFLAEMIRKDLQSITLPDDTADVGWKAAGQTDGAKARSNRNERLERALRRYRQKGHNIELPVDSSDRAAVIPDKEDLLELSERDSEGAI